MKRDVISKHAVLLEILGKNDAFLIFPRSFEHENRRLKAVTGSAKFNKNDQNG